MSVGGLCPWWLGPLLASPLRRLSEDPAAIVGPFVREGATVLEPGPGMGFFTLELARRVGPGGRVVAVDIQPRMLAGLERRATKAGLRGRIEPRLAPAEGLGVGDLDGRVDLVLAWAVVHELPDVDRFFAEVRRALKPSGRLLLAEPGGHVGAAAFAATLGAAERAGLAVEARPLLGRNRTALLAPREPGAGLVASRVRLDGLALHVRSAGASGPPGEPAVLLLHGWPTSSHLWRKVVPHLAGTRLVAPDLPGFGLSDKPGGARYTLDAQSRWLGALADALDLRRVVLVVHDLGGPIGFHWAVRHRERVAGLVVLNTLFHPDGPARLFLSGSPAGLPEVLRSTASPRLKLLLAAVRARFPRRLLFTRVLVRESLRMGTVDRAALGAEDLRAYADPFADAAGRAALARTFLDPRYEELAEIAPLVGTLDVPAEVVVGTSDVLLPGVEDDMRRLATALPRGALRQVPRCGHFVPEDRPDAVVEAVRRVLAAAALDRPRGARA